MIENLKIREKLLEAMNILQGHENETYDPVKGEVFGILDEIYEGLAEEKK